MKTSQFLSNNKGYIPKQKTWCSSVYQDTDGNFYSYGRHYPLLFQVGSLWFVNDYGYSDTTARHINWARSIADHSVKIDDENYNFEPETIVKYIEKEILNLIQETQKKRQGKAKDRLIELTAEKINTLNELMEMI